MENFLFKELLHFLMLYFWIRKSPKSGIPEKKVPRQNIMHFVHSVEQDTECFCVHSGLPLSIGYQRQSIMSYFPFLQCCHRTYSSLLATKTQNCRLISAKPFREFVLCSREHNHKVYTVLHYVTYHNFYYTATNLFCVHI